MTERYKTKKYAKYLFISIILLILLGYTTYETQRIAFGPRINMTSPVNGSLVSDPLVNISGIAKNINDISLNGRKIFLDEKGNFSENMLLSYGYNVITLEASDKFGKKTKKIIEVI